MTRRRPVTRETLLVAQTPAPSVSDNTGRPKSGGSGSQKSVTDKALPLPPNMGKEGTHVDALQAKSDELDRQVFNTQRVIAEMEKLERASPLEVSEKMRRENRKKLDQVRARLEEVRRERHEVGMALARARSRAQDEEGYASPLWLRRVTG